MYTVVKIIKRFSNLKRNLYDPMFERYEELTKDNEDQIINLFFHTLVRKHLTSILNKFCSERPKVYVALIQHLQMEEVTHKEALKNLLTQLHEILMAWMQHVSDVDPTFLGTLFILLLNSKSPHLEEFFNRFNTESQTIFHLFKKISESDINMFHTLSILLIYNVHNAMIIYKMFNNVLICHALIDCMQIPMVNFMTSILKLQVSKNYIPIEQLSFLIYQIPKISPEKSTVPQLLLFNSFCDLLFREMSEKVISGEPLDDAFTGTLLMFENMLNLSETNETIQLSLNCLNLFCEKFDCSFFFTNNANVDRLMNLMLSDSESISYTSWNIFSKWVTANDASFKQFTSNKVFKNHFISLLTKITPIHYLPFARALSEIAGSGLANNEKSSFFSMVGATVNIGKLSKQLLSLIQSGQVPYQTYIENRFKKLIKEYFK